MVKRVPKRYVNIGVCEECRSHTLDGDCKNPECALYVPGKHPGELPRLACTCHHPEDTGENSHAPDCEIFKD